MISFLTVTSVTARSWYWPLPLSCELGTRVKTENTVFTRPYLKNFSFFKKTGSKSLELHSSNSKFKNVIFELKICIHVWQIHRLTLVVPFSCSTAFSSPSKCFLAALILSCMSGVENVDCGMTTHRYVWLVNASRNAEKFEFLTSMYCKKEIFCNLINYIP